MMRRTLALGVIVLVALGFAAPSASAQEESESQLGGYIAGAAGWAFSFQPTLPALVSTGDVPFETTFSLSNASVKSGGNASARGALVWPGSAAANLGPILEVAGQPFLGGLLPPWPAAAEASQRDGEVVKSGGPGMTMRAFGSDKRAEGDVRTPDVNFPGLLRIDSVSSNSVAEVTDVDVTSSCAVHLEGVSILDGAITFNAIHSRSLTRSTGTASNADGDVQVLGLKVNGIAAVLTADGVKAAGLPPGTEQVPGAGSAFPGTNPDDALNQALASLGASIKLTRSVEHTKDGSADRLANGVVVTVKNPAFEGGHFDILLASTGSAALATLPADITVSGVDLSAGGPDLSGALSAPTTGASASSDFSSSDLGGLALGPSTATAGALTAGNDNGAATDLAPSLAGYHFKGVPWRLILVALIVSVFIARWLWVFLQTRLLS